jgi:hypothetical protein
MSASGHSRRPGDEFPCKSSVQSIRKQEKSAIMELSLPKRSIWEGKISGTNRGVVYTRLTKRENSLLAEVIVYDYQCGPSLITASGTLANKICELEMSQFKAMGSIIGMVFPAIGKYNLKLSDDYQKAEGTWKTDIGTQGQIVLKAINGGLLKWRWLLLLVRLQWTWRKLVDGISFLVQLLKNSLVFAYAIFLFFILPLFLLAKNVNISPWVLILLVLPAPFAFKNYVGKLIFLLRTAGVKAVGGLTLSESQNNPPATPNNYVSTGNPYFDELNRLFVLKTKILLLEVYMQEGISEDTFRKLAGRLGLDSLNTEATLSILKDKACMELIDGILKITKAGDDYLRYGIRFP